MQTQWMSIHQLFNPLDYAGVGRLQTRVLWLPQPAWISLLN